MSPDLLSVIVHAGGYIGLLQAAGAVLFLWQFGAPLAASRRRVRKLGIAAALVTIPCIGAHLVLDAARMAGEYPGIMDPGLMRLALWSASGAAHLLQMAGLALIAAGLARGHRFTAGAGVALAILAFPLTGHTSVHAMRWLLAPLLALHVTLVAFWLGALAPLLLALRHETSADAIRLLHRFSSLAGWIVPCIPAAGIAMALVLIPDASALRRPYGQLLGVKLAGFALLMGLAVLNRWRWVPMLAREGARAAVALRRSVLGEYLLISAILVATATLTTFYSPDH
jgi:putative copper export protein